ncbi:MAG TPA: cupin domain-containing protein [Methanoregulaceae archaeon]|mgnify:CR=1 FL=1|nr:MAG: cupin domain-containing protein [Methanolinea sp.]HON81660.1 cupin domain-containing protein [Methanoregulaceae archaeon]HPD10534.1 cupin domain-containing protein [Methanoregulaceae archaeon]HRT15552.1 cupin domain-containing protein [Methanoregulaceae archaeon]HRU31059.1 cupin domain-containing protein [Methanoregulaceae archaeon]
MTTAARDELKGKVLSLKDLVDYQQGTIASRMIVSTPSGSITVFAFDEGEALSEHTAPFDAVLTVIDGRAEVTIGGLLNYLEPGETIIMPANIPHAVSAITRFKMMLTMIRG